MAQITVHLDDNLLFKKALHTILHAATHIHLSMRSILMIMWISQNPSNYGFYKERCGRTRRLKAVWGEEEYKCYHDVDTTCFNMTVANEEGVEVIAETNVKNAPPETIGVMPRWAAIVLGVAVFVILLPCFVCIYKKYCKRSNKNVGWLR